VWDTPPKTVLFAGKFFDAEVLEIMTEIGRYCPYYETYKPVQTLISNGFPKHQMAKE
jgi:hypothetical protein